MEDALAPPGFERPNLTHAQAYDRGEHDFHREAGVPEIFFFKMLFPLLFPHIYTFRACCLSHPERKHFLRGGQDTFQILPQQQ